MAVYFAIAYHDGIKQHVTKVLGRFASFDAAKQEAIKHKEQCAYCNSSKWPHFYVAVRNAVTGKEWVL